MKKNRIPALAGLLVGLISVGCYTLSFTGLLEFVKSANIYPPGLAWIWPAILDGSIISFSIYVVWAIMEQVGKRWAMFLVLAVTGASVTFNVIHVDAAGGTIPRVIASFPPILGFFAFELMMRMLRHYQVDEVLNVTPYNNLPLETAYLVADKQSLPLQDKLKLRREAVCGFLRQKTSLEEIAVKLGVTGRTVQRDIEWLGEKGYLSDVPKNSSPSASPSKSTQLKELSASRATGEMHLAAA